MKARHLPWKGITPLMNRLCDELPSLLFVDNTPMCGTHPRSCLLHQFWTWSCRTKCQSSTSLLGITHAKLCAHWARTSPGGGRVQWLIDCLRVATLTLSLSLNLGGGGVRVAYRLPARPGRHVRAHHPRAPAAGHIARDRPHRRPAPIGAGSVRQASILQTQKFNVNKIVP